MKLAILFVALAGVCLFFYPGRAIPGGPFISFTGDVFLQLCSVAGIVSAFRVLRRGSTAEKVTAVCLCLLAAGISALALSSAIGFWYLRYARGDFFGL